MRIFGIDIAWEWIPNITISIIGLIIFLGLWRKIKRKLMEDVGANLHGTAESTETDSSGISAIDTENVPGPIYRTESETEGGSGGAGPEAVTETVEEGPTVPERGEIAAGGIKEKVSVAEAYTEKKELHEPLKTIGEVEISGEPSVKKRKRIGMGFSRFFVTLIISLCMMFVIMLMFSAIAINTIFAIQEYRLVYIDAMAEPFRFKTILIVIFGIIISYSLLYPLLDYLFLAGRNPRTPTVIHRFLKKRLFTPSGAWAYIKAIMFYIGAVVGVPALISYFAYNIDLRTRFPQLLTHLSIFMFIFIAYAMIIPTMYLAYYSNMPKAMFILEAGKIGRGKLKVGVGRKIIVYILAVFASISFISSTYSFIRSIPILWGQYPELTTSYKDIKNSFFEILVRNILVAGGISETDLERFYLFNAIIPFDFLVFFISTVGFGIYGVFANFWSRSTLNSRQMLLFTSYIFCGLALQIFLKVVMQWPWILPDVGVLEMSDPAHQSIVVFFMGIPYVLMEFFIFIFFVYHIFFNPDILPRVNQGD